MKENLKKYQNSIFVALCLILTMVPGISFELVVFFLFGFVWSWTIHSPIIVEKLKNEKYRITFMRMAFFIQRKWDSLVVKLKLKENYYYFFSSLLPFLILIILSFVFSAKIPAYATLIGSLIYKFKFQFINRQQFTV